MTVYVDALFDVSPAMVTDRWPYKQACHMEADSLEELHAMAHRLGLKRSWFQDRSLAPHYDLTPGMRAKAVRFGAVQLSREQTVARVMAQLRARRGAP